MNEIWKDVKGYHGLYQVSDKGRVWSVERIFYGGGGAVCKTGGKLLKPHFNQYRSNRVSVILCKDGKTKSHYVARLVADAFVDNPENYPEVDHIDTDVTNNNASNLRWVDRKLNMNNPLTKKLLSERVTLEERERRRKRMTGDNNPAKHYTDEWRTKISEVRKGKPNTYCRKAVNQYDLNGNLIASYPSVTEAAKAIGKRPSDISAGLTGRQRTAGGYIWEYAQN